MNTAVKRTEAEAREFLADMANGRDEMNLVELPVFLLSSRAPAGLNVLEFEVEDFDRNLKEVVRRQVTVTGSAKYGIPAAAAEKVW